jgi:formylglycine-generating enzyme required for sulfatase activity
MRLICALGLLSVIVVGCASPTPTVAPPQAATPAPTTVPTPLATPVTNAFAPDNAPMILVPAGDFTMGSDDANIVAYDSGKPAHPVYLDAFWMDKFEVTNARYKKCVDAGKCTEPSNKTSATRSAYFGNAEFDDYPVSYVRWEQARTYCEWAGKRLPTEAEWEKAARGTDGRLFPWGNDFDGTRLNFCDKGCAANWKDDKWEDGFADTSPAGNYARGASPYGIMDLAGNVYEWTADWYDDKYYASSPRNNPTGPSTGQARVVRGGSWDNAAGNLFAVLRIWKGYSSAYINVGFRCAKNQ